MFRIRDILRQIRILGSAYWSTDPDLYPDTVPDPAPFGGGFQDANKKKFLLIKPYYL
jgi:hypothetical protein